MDRANSEPFVTIEVETDGFYHPTSDDEIITLVTRARDEGRTVRVRGSGHSVSHAIYADPLGAIANEVDTLRPPAGRNINILLDRYGSGGVPSYSVVSRDDRVIEVDGGMRLGPTPGAPEPSGLLRRLSKEHGWMLRSTGGIAHQTIAGFMATGSAGGSTTVCFNELIRGVTVIDGTGTVREINKGDDDFRAIVPHLGLLGVVTKVRLRCDAAFTVKGKQVTTSPQAAVVDVSGGRRREPSQVSLAEFLTENEYTRIEWWPQPGLGRVRLWTANADEEPPHDFHPEPFRLFDRPRDQLLAGALLTAIGNRADLRAGAGELMDMLRHARDPRNTFAISAATDPVDDLVHDLREMGEAGDRIASWVEDPTGSSQGLVIHERLNLPDRLLRKLFPRLLYKFMPAGEKDFHDCADRLLPMDDEVDDVYLPIEFTEIWVPLTRADDAMRVLDEFFTENDGASTPFARAGTFQIELYATTPSPFWLDPAYSDPGDDWSEGALRINPYWYRRNPGDPSDTFYPGLWNVLLEKGISYRLHWGKFLPRVEDDPDWAERTRARYPGWDAFMAVRKRYDPHDMFVNDYWDEHLGLTRRRIADMHCHYPMRVLADWSRAAEKERKVPHGYRLWGDRARCLLMKLLARAWNSEHPWKGWRVDLDELRKGHAGLVLSVLYDPVYELLVVPGRQRPRPMAFAALERLMDDVEAELRRVDEGGHRHLVVTTKHELEEALATRRTAFVHCVEGGLYLGNEPDAIKANVSELARRGVAYITLAHLFYRGIASNATALPKPWNRSYECVFRQRERGLSELGRAAVKAMYRHRMLIDITHMDVAALNATFQLLKELDAKTGAKPAEHPVIASHAGYRFGTLLYMLDEATILAIKERNGVIGLIFARDELEDSLDMTKSNGSPFYALRCHIDKIREITGSYDHLCIGSDLDGYTKPTVVQRWADLVSVEDWLRATYRPDAADAILFGNAERVVAGALRDRRPERAGSTRPPADPAACRVATP